MDRSRWPTRREPYASVPAYLARVAGLAGSGIRRALEFVGTVDGRLRDTERERVVDLSVVIGTALDVSHWFEEFREG
jgi:hypothetical protein